MSWKHLLRLPPEYAGLFSHGQEVEVEFIVGRDSYRLRGMGKKYRKGLFVKLPPEAQVLKGAGVPKGKGPCIGKDLGACGSGTEAVHLGAVF